MTLKKKKKRKEKMKKERTTILRNVWKYSHNDTAVYPRRFEFSAIRLSDPQISQ
jgi:hypothetical protein